MRNWNIHHSNAPLRCVRLAKMCVRAFFSHCYGTSIRHDICGDDNDIQIWLEYFFFIHSLSLRRIIETHTLTLSPAYMGLNFIYVNKQICMTYVDFFGIGALPSKLKNKPQLKSYMTYEYRNEYVNTKSARVNRV